MSLPDGHPQAEPLERFLKFGAGFSEYLEGLLDEDDLEELFRVIRTTSQEKLASLVVYSLARDGIVTLAATEDGVAFHRTAA